MIDMQRILDLPILPRVTDEELEKLSEEFIMRTPFHGECRCGNRTCTDPDTKEPKPLRLLEDQASLIRAVRLAGKKHGVFGAVKVGGGKSAGAILAASEEFRRNPNARVLLLLLPNLVRQFMTRDVPWSQTHLNVWIPRWVVLHEKDRQMKLTLAQAANSMPGVYVLPYSQLSLEDGPFLIESIDADLVIADEAHTFRGATDSGRQRLFWDWVRRRQPRGIAMSGSFNRSRLTDYYRIMRWCLGRRMPLPDTTIHMQEWDAVLNSQASEKASREACLRMKPLVTWAKRNYPGAMKDLSETTRVIRKAFKLRLRSSPGVVVSTKGTALKTAITIENLEVGEPSARLNELIKQLETRNTTPDGRVLLCALETHQVMHQLSCGFWLKHSWNAAHPRVEEAMNLDGLHRDYRGELRAFLKSGTAKRLQLYIPTTVGNYHKNEGAIEGYGYLFKLWKKWKRAAATMTPEEFRACQVVEPQRVDDFKVKVAAAWGKKLAKPGGIVWVYHQAFGDWILEALQAKGVKVMRKDADAPWAEDDGSEKFVCVASGPAHGVGRNLQHHTNQLIAQWFRSHDKTEQLIGRTHRTGQNADRLTIHLAAKLEFDHMSIDATLKDTVYDRQTFGGTRKLLLADWNPMPKEYPADFLRERGFVLEADGSQDENEDSYHG